MAISIVRLGSPLKPGEGLRIGTVRWPPRGVPKGEFAQRNFYGAWLPNLSPSAPLVGCALKAATDADWKSFERKFRAEMKLPGPLRILDLLASLSHSVELLRRLRLRRRGTVSPLDSPQAPR
jgi:uncharacterized protein YeaO (DUF488 family)